MIIWSSDRMVCIHRGYTSSSILARYSLEDIEPKLAEVERCLEGDGFPDMDIEVELVDNSRISELTYCRADVCSKAIHIEVTTDIFFSLSGLGLSILIEEVIEEANDSSDHTISNPLACLLRGNVYVEGWKHRDEDPSLIAHWSKMDRCVVDAIKMLKEAGLLDDLPEHVFYVNEKERANVFQRKAYIPIKADEYGTTDAKIIAKVIYQQYLVPHIVTNAVYTLKLDDYIGLEIDMMHAAEMALEG